MDAVEVQKAELLEALNKNRDGHRTIFLEAQEGWRAYIIEILDARLEDARAGRSVDMSFRFPAPEDHTSDYDRVIKMVEMEVAATIEISEVEFAQYVMDDWDWMAQWSGANVHYSKTLQAKAP